MRPRTTLGRRLQRDRRFRIVFSAGCTLVVNMFYGLAHGVFGVLEASAWLLTMAAYHILMGVMRFGAVLTERRRGSERFVMRFCGGMLTALAVILGVSTALSILQDRAVPHGLIIMLTIAVYTFWKLTMAIIHTVQAHLSGTPLTRTIRNITLASALASMMTMQRSMLASFGADMPSGEVLIFNALTGAGVCLLVLLMGLNMIFGERRFSRR